MLTRTEPSRQHVLTTMCTQAHVRWVVASVLIVALLLAPAIWNGYPVIWADTGGYLARPFERTLEIGRSALYGTLLAATVRLDFWPALVLQAAVAGWMIALTLRTHGLGYRPWLTLAVVAGLALTTSLPWYASVLMPDIFVPLAVLAFYLLGFRRESLRHAEVVGVAGVLAFAIASHMAILGLTIALVVALALFRFLAPYLRIPKPSLSAPGLAVAAGIALALLSNFAIAGKLTFTPGGPNFVFSRLVQDGIVGRYLAERCPDTSLRLCEYRDELPVNADGWLWGWGSPFYKLGGAEGFEPEARRIILDTLTMYPAQHLATAARAAWQQLLLVKSGEGFHSRDSEHAFRALAHHAPGVLPRVQMARQQRDELFPSWINLMHEPIALIACALLPLIILAGWRGHIEPASAAFALTVLLALMLNAAISGGLSNPNDRYQSRIVWLAPFAVVVAALRVRTQRT